MSTDKGYIKVYRDVWDHWVWNQKPFDMAHAWIDLIMLANHEDKVINFNGYPLSIKRGQHMTSFTILAERWGWSRSKVRRFISALESQQMIDTKRNTSETLLTLVNYGVYQDVRNTKRHTDETLTKRKRNADGHKQDTIEDTIEDTIKNSAPYGAEEEPEDEPGWEDDEGWGFD